MKKLITLFLVLTGMVGTASAIDYDVFKIKGVSGLTGSDWSEITLTDEDGDGTYTYTTTQALTANYNYEYKYGFDGNWDVANNSNRTFSVQADGNYLITFSVNKANANSYNDKYYACDTYAIFLPESVTFMGQGVTSNTWGDDTGSFTKEGNSWVYNIDTTIDNVYFHFIMNGQEYSINSNKWFNPTDGWNQDMKTWSDYINKNESFCLSKLSTLDYSRYSIKITPYHDNIYMEVSAYVKATTNSKGYCTLVNSNALKISGATAYYATDNDNGSATAVAITYPAANTPILIHGGNGTDYYFAVNSDAGVDVSSSNAFKAGNGSLIYGGSGPYNYVLNGDAFYLAKSQANGGTTVASGKAYLQLNAQASSARVLLFADDETQGINAIPTAKANDGAYYNLSGQRVNAPTKGLYIQNGKKMIVK